jgi:hypothetical protein
MAPMRQYVFETVEQTDERTLLRLRDGGGGLMGQRTLEMSAVRAPIDEVEAGCRADAPDLPGLGRKLYDWLDGPEAVAGARDRRRGRRGDSYRRVAGLAAGCAR